MKTSFGIFFCRNVFFRKNCFQDICWRFRKYWRNNTIVIKGCKYFCVTSFMDYQLPCMSCCWVYEMCCTDLLEKPQPLELRRVDHGHGQRRKSNVSMDAEKNMDTTDIPCYSVIHFNTNCQWNSGVPLYFSGPEKSLQNFGTFL